MGMGPGLSFWRGGGEQERTGNGGRPPRRCRRIVNEDGDEDEVEEVEVIAGRARLGTRGTWLVGNEVGLGSRENPDGKPLREEVVLFFFFLKKRGLLWTKYRYYRRREISQRESQRTSPAQGERDLLTEGDIRQGGGLDFTNMGPPV